MNGTWKFKTDPDAMGDVSPDVVRNTIGATQQECKFFDPEFDDRHWGEITVPACWQAQGHHYNGVAWYRTRFEYRPGDPAAVVRLSFRGVDYFADAWINGYYLGSHEGFSTSSASTRRVGSGPARTCWWCARSRPRTPT